jgi:hypothetical protein
VKVFDNNPDEHVEHEKADKEQERYEVEQAPFVVIDLGLKNSQKTGHPRTTILNPDLWI